MPSQFDANICVPDEEEIRQLYGISNWKMEGANKPELQRACVMVWKMEGNDLLFAITILCCADYE
jgi:hypothetical protein